MNIIKEVKELKRTIVEISLADVANSEQSILLPNIKANAMRYVELFEDAIDEIMPSIDVQVEATRGIDIYNVLKLSICLQVAISCRSISRTGKSTKGDV